MHYFEKFRPHPAPTWNTALVPRAVIPPCLVPTCVYHEVHVDASTVEPLLRSNHNVSSSPLFLSLPSSSSYHRLLEPRYVMTRAPSNHYNHRPQQYQRHRIQRNRRPLYAYVDPIRLQRINDLSRADRFANDYGWPAT